jgi:hypothetical protein
MRMVLTGTTPLGIDEPAALIEQLQQVQKDLGRRGRGRRAAHVVTARGTTQRRRGADLLRPKPKASVPTVDTALVGLLRQSQYVPLQRRQAQRDRTDRVRIHERTPSARRGWSTGIGLMDRYANEIEQLRGMGCRGAAHRPRSMQCGRARKAGVRTRRRGGRILRA